jgi:hypothetical protein
MSSYDHGFELLALRCEDSIQDICFWQSEIVGTEVLVGKALKY